jgi:hypothetical protein
MKETYTKHFDGTSLNLGQVFSFYGTQVYFPLFLIVALTCTLTFPIKKPDELGVPSPLTRPTSNLLTIISCTWLMLPFVFFSIL